MKMIYSCVHMYVQVEHKVYEDEAGKTCRSRSLKILSELRVFILIW